MTTAVRTCWCCEEDGKDERGPDEHHERGRPAVYLFDWGELMPMVEGVCEYCCATWREFAKEVGFEGYTVRSVSRP